MVAETKITSFSFTIYLRTAGTARGDHCECAVRSRAPSRVWVRGQHSPQHQRLVEVQQRRVLAHQHLDVVGVKSFTTLGTFQVDSALLNLNPDVLLQTHYAGEMMTVPKIGKLAENCK